MVRTGDTPSALLVPSTTYLMLLIPILQRQIEVKQPAQGHRAREWKTQGMSSDVLLRGCTLPPSATCFADQYWAPHS